MEGVSLDRVQKLLEKQNDILERQAKALEAIAEVVKDHINVEARGV